MKKSYFILSACALSLAGMCAFAGCGPGNGNDNYAKLNSMLQCGYSQITLTVTDSFGVGAQLDSAYTFSYFGDLVKVEYSVERFAQIDSSLTAAPEELKTTLKGDAIVMNGELLGVHGDDVGITEEIVRIGLNFKADYFVDAEFTETHFAADVSDPSSFIGSDITCTGMKAEAVFMETFTSITINYTSEMGGNVQIKYEFTL